MNSGLEYPALVRLLSLNNQVHDLEIQLRQVVVPQEVVGTQATGGTVTANRIAQMQEEIDHGVRASLVTCWLGIPPDAEE